jgi:SAM-dependent methyltransferase
MPPSASNSAADSAFPCPVCSAPSAPIFRAGEYPIRLCSACHHRFAELIPASNHVGTVYDDTYFFGGGAGYANYLDEAVLLRGHGTRYTRILRRFCPPGTVLDIGCAAGFIMDGFRAAGWQPTGLEPNPRMADHARTELGIEVHTSALEDFRPDASFDLVTMIQVIGHLAALHPSMDVVRALLRPGGYLLIESWDAESWTARVFGRRWHEYSPPSVLHYFSRTSLLTLAQLHGFRLVASGRPAKKIAAGHAKSLLQHKLRAPGFRLLHPILRLIPEGLVLPYPSEDLRWMLFHKQ